MTTLPQKNRLRDALGSAAPQLARALGGPLAGTAVSLLAQVFLGTEEAEEAELLEAVVSASPEQMVELRKAEIAFREAILSASVEEKKIAQEDRASARARQVSLRDRVPGALAVVVLAGFFAVLAVMLVHDIPEGAETEFSIMLGALATMSAAVMNYYFGSSASSREKTWMLQAGSGHRKDG